jgi:hypothetical protein
MLFGIISHSFKDLVEIKDVPSLHTLVQKVQMTQNQAQRVRARERRLRKVSLVLGTRFHSIRGC